LLATSQGLCSNLGRSRPVRRTLLTGSGMVPAVSSWPTPQGVGVTRRGTSYAGQAIRDRLDSNGDSNDPAQRLAATAALVQVCLAVDGVLTACPA
jgi:hypothetical protein